MKTVIALAALAVLISGCATRGDIIHFREGVDAETFNADVVSCYDETQAGGIWRLQNVEENEVYKACFARRGYKRTELTRAEMAELNALNTLEERVAWVARFASQNHEARAIP